MKLSVFSSFFYCDVALLLHEMDDLNCMGNVVHKGKRCRGIAFLPFAFQLVDLV